MEISKRDRKAFYIADIFNWLMAMSVKDAAANITFSSIKTEDEFRRAWMALPFELRTKDNLYKVLESRSGLAFEKINKDDLEKLIDCLQSEKEITLDANKVMWLWPMLPNEVRTEKNFLRLNFEFKGAKKLYDWFKSDPRTRGNLRDFMGGGEESVQARDRFTLLKFWLYQPVEMWTPDNLKMLGLSGRDFIIAWRVLPKEYRKLDLLIEAKVGTLTILDEALWALPNAELNADNIAKLRRTESDEKYLPDFFKKLTADEVTFENFIKIMKEVTDAHVITMSLLDFLDGELNVDDMAKLNGNKSYEKVILYYWFKLSSEKKTFDNFMKIMKDVTDVDIIVDGWLMLPSEERTAENYKRLISINNEGAKVLSQILIVDEEMRKKVQEHYKRNSPELDLNFI